MSYYFVRVNGYTTHNDPNNIDCCVNGEPPVFPETYFNYCQYCLDNNIIRIGWPDVGDILSGNKVNTLANCYDLYSIDGYIKDYLNAFSQIPIDSIILMPNPNNNPGELYCGRVVRTYWYYHNLPIDPYECSHRLGVLWDRRKDDTPIKYNASQFNMSTQGTPFAKAFSPIRKESIIKGIRTTRYRYGFEES